jgi:formaldehyde-activating enzyme involved in methanogenesis
MYIGESFIGEGAGAAHVNTVLGDQAGAPHLAEVLAARTQAASPCYTAPPDCRSSGPGAR